MVIAVHPWRSDMRAVSKATNTEAGRSGVPSQGGLAFPVPPACSAGCLLACVHQAADLASVRRRLTVGGPIEAFLPRRGRFALPPSAEGVRAVPDLGEAPLRDDLRPDAGLHPQDLPPDGLPAPEQGFQRASVLKSKKNGWL